MTARTHPAPDRRPIVGGWVLTVVLGILTLASLAGQAEATPGADPVAVAKNARPG